MDGNFEHDFGDVSVEELISVIGADEEFLEAPEQQLSPLSDISTPTSDDRVPTKKRKTRESHGDISQLRVTEIFLSRKLMHSQWHLWNAGSFRIWNHLKQDMFDGRVAI